MLGSEARGHVLALITIAIWGTTFVSTKVLLEAFQPVDILFYRFAIGFLALLALRPRHVKLASWKQESVCAAAGITGVTLYFLLENIALTFTTASNVGIIVSVAPFFTALVAYFAHTGERLRVGFFIGFAIAMAGIVLISSQGVVESSVGDLLAVAAAAVWALYSTLSKKISTFGYDGIQMTKRTFAWGLLFMVPALFVFGFDFGIARFADPVNVANMLFLGLGASALCFVTWNRAVSIIGAVKTSAYIYLVPVITVAASVIVLGEPLTTVIAAGVALTCIGLVVSEWGKEKPEEPKDGPVEVACASPGEAR